MAIGLTLDKTPAGPCLSSMVGQDEVFSGWSYCRESIEKEDLLLGEPGLRPGVCSLHCKTGYIDHFIALYFLTSGTEQVNTVGGMVKGPVHVVSPVTTWLLFNTTALKYEWTTKAINWLRAELQLQLKPVQASCWGKREKWVPILLNDLS